MKTPIALDNIQLGAAVEKFNELLAKISDDVVKRPTLKKPRRVTLTVEVTPQYDAESRMNFPDIDWKVDYSVPGSKGMTTKAFVDGGRLIVNTNDPMGESPHQTNLLDVADGTA